MSHPRDQKTGQFVNQVDANQQDAIEQLQKDVADLASQILDNKSQVSDEMNTLGLRMMSHRTLQRQLLDDVARKLEVLQIDWETEREELRSACRRSIWIAVGAALVVSAIVACF